MTEKAAQTGKTPVTNGHDGGAPAPPSPAGEPASAQPTAGTAQGEPPKAEPAKPPPPEAALPPPRPQDYEVVEEMPHFLARGLVYIVAAFALTAFVWATLGRLDVVVTGKGAVTPLGDSIRVQPEFGGTVVEIYKHEADEVAPGDPILRLESIDRKNRSLQTRMDYENARNQLALQEKEALTYERLAKKGVIANLEYISKRKEYENARRRILQLESEMKMAESNEARNVVRSPAGGRIAFMKVHNKGHLVGPSELVATIVPKDAPLVMELQVPNKDIAKVKLGQGTKHMLDAFPYQEYGLLTGKVIHISPDAAADQQGNRYYVVRASFDEAAYHSGGKKLPIFPGLTGSTHVVTKRRSPLSYVAEPFTKLRGGMSVAE